MRKSTRKTLFLKFRKRFKRTISTIPRKLRLPDSDRKVIVKVSIQIGRFSRRQKHLRKPEIRDRGIEFSDQHFVLPFHLFLLPPDFPCFSIPCNSFVPRYIALFDQTKPKIVVQALTRVANRFVKQFHDQIDAAPTLSAPETVISTVS